MTCTLNRPWSNIHTAHCHTKLDIGAELFVNSTMGSKDIERSNRQTDRRTDGRTDNTAKNNMSPHLMGGET